MAENNTSRGKWFFRYLFWPLVALVTFGLTRLFEKYPGVTESFYSGGVYPFVGKSLSVLSSLVPFSLSDIFYAIIAIGILVLFILLILRRITLGRWAGTMVSTAAILYILFYWFWGFNYFRQPIHDRIGLNHAQPDDRQFMHVFAGIVNTANQTRPDSMEVADLASLDSAIEQSYRRFAQFLEIGYPMGVRRPKQVIAGSFFAKAGISGYYGPFFNEVHLNGKMHPLEMPIVMAHEKAHQFGITSEAETSFYGWLVCYYSDNEVLRYSASLYAIRYFLNDGFRREGFQQVADMISYPVVLDLRSIRDHWLSMRVEKIDKAASKVNDAYLKSNKVKKGVLDYQGVTGLIMDFQSDPSAVVRVLVE